MGVQELQGSDMSLLIAPISRSESSSSDLGSVEDLSVDM